MDNMDGQSDKHEHIRTVKASIYGRSSNRKESPVDWTSHEDVTRQATKADSLLSIVFWSQKERAPLPFHCIIDIFKHTHYLTISEK